MLLADRHLHIRHVLTEIVFDLAPGERVERQTGPVPQRNAQRITEDAAAILPLCHILPEQNVTAIMILCVIKHHITVKKLTDRAVVSYSQLITGQSQKRNADHFLIQ